MAAVLEVREPSAKDPAASPSALLRQLDLLATATGAVARLRELILTLAVEGRLVAQSATDDPASELLTKARNVMAGRQQRRGQRNGQPKDSAEFYLPQGWVSCKGAAIYDVLRGVSYEKAVVSDSPKNDYVPILRANNIGASINFDDLVYVPRHFVSDEQLLQDGDFVVCMASGSKRLVGKAAPFAQLSACSFGAFCGALRPAMDLPFLSIYLASPLYREAVSEASSGIGINNLKSTTLLELSIPLPPLSEQARIVARVEELMRLCHALEAKGRLEAEQHARLLSTLLGTLTDSRSPEELAAKWHRVAANFDLLIDRPEAVDALEQTVIDSAVAGGFSDESAGESTHVGASDGASRWSRAVSWPTVRFKDVLEELRYGTAVKCGYGGVGTPVLRIPNLQQGRIDLTDLKYGVLDDRERSALSLRRGDLLIVRSNGSAALVGTIAMVEEAGEEFAFAGYLVRARVKQDQIDPRYMLLVSQSKDFRRQIEAPIRTTSGVKNINSTEISALGFTLPSVPEQRRIVARVTHLRRLCADLRQRLAASRATQARLADALIDSATAA